MEKFYFTLLLTLIIVATGHSACDKEFRYHTIENPFENTIVTVNSTTVCTNVTSVGSLENMPKQDFDQFLKITDSRVKIIPPLAFFRFSIIKKLFMSGVYVEEILPGAFIGLSKLTELHLDNNKLSEVSTGVYNSLEQLKVLNLSNNRIKRIEKFALMGVAKLRQLFLRNNHISRIEGVFETLTKLKELDLAENPLVKISLAGSTTNLGNVTLTNTWLNDLDTSFTNLTINNLDLASSRFTSVDFVRFPKTQKIDLSNNKIVSICNCDFLNSSIVTFANNRIKMISGTFFDLSKLDLSHNKMKNLTTFRFNNTKTLEELNFSYNRISLIDKTLLTGLDNLLRLFLQFNKIIKIEVPLFKDLASLLFLNLSYNKIDNLEYGTFDFLKNLEILDISNNKLVDLHQYALNPLSNLQVLHFDNNQISTLDESNLKKSFSKLKVLTMDGNAWICQELVFFLENLKRAEIQVKSGSHFDEENVNGISCSSNYFREFEEDSKNFTESTEFANYEEGRENLDEEHAVKIAESESDDIFAFVVIQLIIQMMFVFVVLVILKYLFKKRGRRNVHRIVNGTEMF